MRVSRHMAINPSADVLRAPRALVGWTQRDLSAVSKVSRPTINRLENGGAAMVETVQALVKTYEAHGIEFIGISTTSGEGVRWRTPAGRIGEDPQVLKSEM